MKQKLAVALLIMALIFSSPIKSHGYSETKGVERGDTIVVAYKLVLDNGTVLTDAERETFPGLDYGKYIDGFVDEVLGMKIGEKKTFRVPPEKAYTDPGHYLYGLALIYTVTLLDVENYTSQNQTNDTSDNFVTTLLRILAWTGGLIVLPILAIGVYRYINSSFLHKSAHICSIGGEKAAGKCANCGTPYCRSHFIKGCANCKGVTLQPY